MRDRVQRQPVKQGVVLFGLRIPNLQVRYQRARMGGGHAGAKAKFQCDRTSCGHDVPLPGAHDQDCGLPPERRPCERLDSLRCAAAVAVISRHGLEHVLGRFAAPSHLAHGRALMRWHGVNIGLGWPSAERAIACPAGAGTPAARFGDGAGARIIVDRQGEAWGDRDRCRLRQPGGTLCLAQSLDRELRQVERGDPCHRTLPVRERRDCRSAAGRVLLTSAADQGRHGGGNLTAQRRCASASWPRKGQSRGSGRDCGGGGKAASAFCHRKPPVEAGGSRSDRRPSPPRQRRQAIHRVRRLRQAPISRHLCGPGHREFCPAQGRSAQGPARRDRNA